MKKYLFALVAVGLLAIGGMMVAGCGGSGAATASTATATFAVNEPQSVTIGSDTHTVTVNGISGNTVTVTIQSDPITVEVTYGIPQDVDTDANGKDDLRVEVAAAPTTIATLEFTALTENANTSTATITHFGFDFATGRRTDEAGVYDGEVINWNPDYVNSVIDGVTYEGTGYPCAYLWWRGANTLQLIAHQKHLGTVELSSVTTVPTTWESGANLCPLLDGHVYVAMCSPEGYVKFKVTSVPSSVEVLAGASWEAVVEYKYTSGNTF